MTVTQTLSPVFKRLVIKLSEAFLYPDSGQGGDTDAFTFGLFPDTFPILRAYAYQYQFLKKLFTVFSVHRMSFNQNSDRQS